jgi:hypothetical protein
MKKIIREIIIWILAWIIWLLLYNLCIKIDKLDNKVTNIESYLKMSEIDVSNLEYNR